MLICEDLFLLLTTDEGGTEPWVSYRDYGLAAGLLADLTLAQCLTVEPGRWGGTKVSLAAEADPASTAALREQSPPLAFGIEALADRKPTAVSTVVVAGWFNPRQAIVDGLTERGIVGVVGKRMLGLVPEKHPTLDARPEADTRARLLAALQGARPAAADALILSVLKSLGAAPHVLKAELEAAGMRRGQAHKRIDELTEALPVEASAGGKAVASAIAGIQAAIGAAVAASVAGGAAASN
ncbi:MULTISPECIES: GOLPH3/VPS74 family protein [Brevibacterium]|uniref:GPP34 family phosphoprotein n=1 Tax=Brevibacterium salitolerans TaxID=1403566 RepID=A0ABN2WTA1_9MICO|nr:GPP34 family phosphoprotein [Brevibacterium sp.]